ncbi:protein of unknown function [Micropruina glycogenica]|uniref:Uncharacterized protein n=1 Tax=Micropruina glycogenica TaxID=75385 RepID=A0A2N9JEX5_9ACTN|nr:protein of unknown function [Micropruina glycogenica]
MVTVPLHSFGLGWRHGDPRVFPAAVS